MSAILWLSSLRYLIRHPWQVGLSVLGVALGVAVVVSIDLANQSAKRAFSRSIEAVSTLTVLENLLLPLNLNGITGREAKERTMNLLGSVGLADRAGSFPDKLSGGEQQRVAIARALAHDPLLVLADEPTGNLDSETGRQVMSLLEQLVRNRGKTAIVVTHRTEVASLADKVFTIREGSLEEVAAGDTVLKSFPVSSDFGELPS